MKTNLCVSLDFCSACAILPPPLNQMPQNKQKLAMMACMVDSYTEVESMQWGQGLQYCNIHIMLHNAVFESQPFILKTKSDIQNVAHYLYPPILWLILCC